MVGTSYSPPSPKKRTDQQTWQRHVGPLLERLTARDADVAMGAISVIRTSLPSYRDVPDDALRASSLRNTRNVIKTLSARRLPSEDELAQAAVAAGDRARQGVPVQDALTAYRISVHHIREFLTEAAARGAVPPDVALEMFQFVWALADAVSVRMASSHRDAEVEIARHDERQRAEFLRGLMFGSLGTAEIRRLGPAYNLAPDRRYVALRGRPSPGSTTAELARAISAAAHANGTYAFVDSLEGEVVGVAPGVPEIKDCRATVGVGPPADLAAMEPSFATASRVLEVAVRFSHVGVFRLDDLAVLVAVAAEDELGELLVRRYLQPLEHLGGWADAIRATVEVFIDQGLNIKSTARELDVHPNTVRHRLERFEELTGASLGRPKSAVEVWWALQRAWMDSHSDEAAPPQVSRSSTPPDSDRRRGRGGRRSMKPPE